MSVTRQALAVLAAGLLFAGPAYAACTVITWNPSDKGPLTLSNGNLTATAIASNTAAVRATSTVNSSGKWFWSDLIGTVDANRPFFGFGNASAILSNFVGIDNNSLGYGAVGAVFLNSVSLSTIATFVAGDRIDIALDIPHTNVWFRKNGGNWNNSGTANPSTNTGGISFSTMAAGPYFPMTSEDNTSADTVNFGATNFVSAPPAGFIAPGACPSGALFFMGPF